MSINDAATKAQSRHTAYLNSQLSNGDNFYNCNQCDRKFYPLYSSAFCSKDCAQEAFRVLSQDCQLSALDETAALEILAVIPDDANIKDVRKIALLTLEKREGKLFGD